jgi:hypothetical protein
MNPQTLQWVLITIGAASWATLPSEAAPSFLWRGHYGVALFAFGVSFGVQVGRWIQRKQS